MAAFNTAPPEMQPEQFLRYSSPIQQPPANTSTAQMIGVGAEALQGGAQLADSTIKESLKNDIYKKVDPLRDAYTQSMEAINNGIPTDPAANPGASATAPAGVGPQIKQSTYGYAPKSAGDPQNLMPDNAPAPVPSSLQSGLDKVSVMAEAAKQNGHYNDTQYTAQLTAVAKQLRAQYPGYRPYIDEQISSASGIPIANAYVKNLIEDANRQAAGTKSETEKNIAFIRQNSDLPGAPEMMQSYMQNGDFNKVMQWANYNQGIKSELALKKAQQEVQTGDRKVDTDATTDYANTVVNHAATNFFYNKRFATGDKTPAQVADAVTYAHLHPEAADDEAMTKLGGQYQAYRAQYYNETMRVMNQPGKDGKSVMDKLGPDATMALVNKAGDAMFGATSQMIYDKDFGAAHLNQSLSTAIVNNATMKIQSDQTIGAPTNNIAAITKLAPQVAPIIFANIAKAGYDTDLGAFTAAQKLKGLAQPDILRNGQTYTFADSVGELKKYGNQTGTEVPGTAYKGLTDLTEAITNPKSTPELRARAFQYFFDPKNNDVMSNFKEGYYDPSQKRMVQGREAAFAALTSPEVTAQAYAMKQQGHPEIWDNYKNWAQHEAGVHLIRNDVNNLGDAMASGHNHISWNSDSHHVGITNPDGTPLSGLQTSMLNMPYRSVTNINNVLDHMQAIAKAEGTNVDAYMYNTLRSINTPVAQKLMSALAVANGGKVPVSAPISRFAPESKGPSVQDFVRNPIGGNPPIVGGENPLEPYQTRNIIRGNLSDQPIDAPVRTAQ